MIARGAYQERIWWLLQQGQTVVVPVAPRYHNSLLRLLTRARKAGYTIERAHDDQGQLLVRLKGARE